MRKIGLTYDELVVALGKNGWSFHPADFSWRGPGGEPCASIEALQDICEIYPVLTRQMLRILLAGHNFEISMKEVEKELRAGITATVEVHIETIEDSLHVPVHAVFKDGETFICFVPTESGFGREEVTIGKSNEHYVVIETGLAEGDRVLLFDPREGEVAEDQEADERVNGRAIATDGDDE